tara:strand:+ start:100 stop:561 length:462 start_codon:yes stop_codon:yes gene_type:complete
MILKLKNILSNSKNADKDEITSSSKNIAAAALLIEAACIDGKLDSEEQKIINTRLEKYLRISNDEILDLIKEASKVQSESNQIFGFTKEIKNSFSEEQKLDLIEILWDVICSDQIIHIYESNLMRRICGLIYVSDKKSGEIKLKVMKKYGIEK